MLNPAIRNRALALVLAFATSVSAQGTLTLQPTTCYLDGAAAVQASCGIDFVQRHSLKISSSKETEAREFDYSFLIRSATTGPINVNIIYVASSLSAASAGSFPQNPSICKSVSATAAIHVSIAAVGVIGNPLLNANVQSHVQRGGPEPGNCTYESQVSWLNQAEETQPMQLMTNTEYRVSLVSNQTIAFIAGQSDFAFAWAFLDPTISADTTTYPDATVVLSDGVPNSTTSSDTIDQLSQADVAAALDTGGTDAPLPIWALGALGAGLIGTVVRRLRR